MRVPGMMLSALLALGAALPAQAQEGPGAISVTVTEIAGGTFYVDQGRLSGLFEGDTVRARRNTRNMGSLVVVSAARRQALLAFATAPFRLTLGDTLLLTLPARRVGRTTLEDASASAAALPATATPLFPQGDPPLAAGGAGIVLEGRLDLTMDARTARLEGSSTLGQRQPFITPTARLRLRAGGLPGNAHLRANLRGSYRSDPRGLVDPVRSVRVYELAIAKELEQAPLGLHLGRFYNPHESFSGYWDGVLARMGSERFGAGAALGFEPELWNEGFSTARPKSAAFADLRLHGADRGLESDVAVVRVLPDSTAEQLYVGWSARAWVGALSLAHSVQIDRSPTTSEWVVSELLIQASVPLGSTLMARGQWSHREPHYFWASPSPFSYQRDDLGGGLSALLGRGIVSADVAVHRAAVDQRWIPSYSGFIRIYPARRGGYGVHASGSVWDNGLIRLLTVAGGLDRNWGRGSGSLGYRLTRSESTAGPFTTQQVDLGLNVPLAEGVRASLLSEGRVGQGLSSARVQFGLTRSF